MNHEKALDVLERIFNEKHDEHVCVFIDGQWGVGKTYTIEQFEKKHEDLYEVKHISVFGKNNLRDIEKDIIINLSSFYKVFNNELFQKSGFKFGFNIAKSVSKKFTGMELGLSQYIDNITIENINKKDNVVICIDDLERKSDKLEFKDLLGLVERTSTKFDVILIGSTINLPDNEKGYFSKFKEKLIDYHLCIDEVSDNTLVKILDPVFENMDDDCKNEIINAFRRVRLNDKQELKNLRIYKQYINLLKRVNNESCKLINNRSVCIDSKIIVLCMNIIAETFLKQKISDSSFGYNDQQIKKVINNIFNYEDYNKTILKEYFKDYTEIQEDIRKIRYLYKMKKQEAKDLFQKIITKVDTKDLNYFLTQEYIISLYDVLVESGLIKWFDKCLKDIATMLYVPKLGEIPKRIELEDWNNFDYYGESMNRNVISIINHINNYNIQTYKKYCDEIIEKALNSNDVDEIYNVLNYTTISSFEKFEYLFNLAFEKIKDDYDENIWEFISRLISKTDSSVIGSYFIARANETEKIMEACRLKEFDAILQEKIYYECEEEAYRQYQEEYGEE